jgi:hypothetical protein
LSLSKRALRQAQGERVFKEALKKSFDKLRTSDKQLIPFALSLSKRERNLINQKLIKGRVNNDKYCLSFHREAYVNRT